MSYSERLVEENENNVKETETKTRIWVVSEVCENKIKTLYKGFRQTRNKPSRINNKTNKIKQNYRTENDGNNNDEVWNDFMKYGNLDYNVLFY